MSKVICIPCLNQDFYDHKYVIVRHSRARCSVCGELCKGSNRQGLLVKILNIDRACTHPDGCDDIKIKYVCKKGECDAD